MDFIKNAFSSSDIERRLALVTGEMGQLGGEFKDGQISESEYIAKYNALSRVTATCPTIFPSAAIDRLTDSFFERKSDGPKRIPELFAVHIRDPRQRTVSRTVASGEDLDGVLTKLAWVSRVGKTDKLDPTTANSYMKQVHWQVPPHIEDCLKYLSQPKLPGQVYSALGHAFDFSWYGDFRRALKPDHAPDAAFYCKIAAFVGVNSNLYGVRCGNSDLYLFENGTLTKQAGNADAKGNIVKLNKVRQSAAEIRRLNTRGASPRIYILASHGFTNIIGPDMLEELLRGLSDDATAQEVGAAIGKAAENQMTTVVPEKLEDASLAVAKIQ